MEPGAKKYRRPRQRLREGAVLTLSALLLFAAVAVLAAEERSRTKEERIAREFQELAHGLGLGPAVDISVCPFAFDPRICSRCPRDIGTLPLGAAFALTVLLRLGSVIPQGPGNVGTFNGVTVIGLRLFGVPLAIAKRFSIILWAAVTMPLLVAGFIAVATTGIKMGELHGDAKAHMRSRESVLED